MRATYRLVIFTAMCFVIAGCATSQPPAIWTSTGFDVSRPGIHAILPFADANETQYKPLYPDAAKTVREAVETALLQAGFPVVASAKMDTVVDQPVTEEQAIQIAKRVNADVAVFGTVTSFYRGHWTTGHTTVGFGVKGIDVASGTVAWKASIVQSPKWVVDPDPAAYAFDLARQAINELAKLNR